MALRCGGGMRNEDRPKKPRKGQWRPASVCMSRPLSAKTKSCACRTVQCNRNARSFQKRARFYQTREQSSNGDGRCLQNGLRRGHSNVCRGLSVARSISVTPHHPTQSSPRYYVSGEGSVSRRCPGDTHAFGHERGQTYQPFAAPDPQHRCPAEW